MAGRDYWLSIAQSDDPDDLREHILTGFKDGKPFTPYVPTIPLPAPIGQVLDFGCGVGRTFPFLFDAGECVEVDHDPATDQLRVLGRPSFHAACAADARGHYEVLLRSRI